MPTDLTEDICIRKTILNSIPTFMKLKWIENNQELFHLQLILCNENGGGSGWSGTFTTELAEEFIADLCQSKDDYYLDVKNCLLGKYGNKYDLELSDCETDTATFTWKRKYEDFLQKFGSLKINRDNDVSKDTLLEFLINKNNELCNQICEIEDRKKEISEELANCKSELEKMLNIRNDLESKLYGKFVLLLNTKKQRIKFLEEQLQKYVDF